MIRSCFVFKENHFFFEEEDKPSDKVAIVEEELDDIENLVDLPRLMFTNEEYRNLKEVVDDR